MKAAQAKRMSDGNLLDASKKQLDDIYHNITEATRSGSYEIILGRDLLPDVERRLRSDGFNISKHLHRNEQNVCISWKSPMDIN